MSGHNSSRLRWDCDKKGCQNQHGQSWDDLYACFPRGIRPTDVDGMVEVNGQFLFLEEKGAGGSLQGGQGAALRGLAKLDGVTVVCFRPRTSPPHDLDVLIMDGSPLTGWEPRPRDWLKAWLRDWVAKADLAVAS